MACDRDNDYEPIHLVFAPVNPQKDLLFVSSFSKNESYDVLFFLHEPHNLVLFHIAQVEIDLGQGLGELGGKERKVGFL